ncbi:unnamed protein product, partial [Candidula unifasciata]
KLCQSLGAKLVEIDTKEENDCIVHEIQSIDFGTAWIGLTDNGTEGQWRWSTNRAPGSFRNWASGNPDNYLG